MLRSLRNRLILSHVLPALLIIPLMGVAMGYVLETRWLLPRAYEDLSRDATLVAQITRDQPIFWQDARTAQALVNGIDPYLSGRISFVTLDGRVLASSDAVGGGLSLPQVELPDLTGIHQGEIIELQRGPLAEVFTPVFDLRGQPTGIIHMTTRVLTVSDEIYQLRYLLGIVLLLGVLAGVGLGSYLALTINRPIQRVTRSIQALADGNWQQRVQVQGPDEMRALAAEVNTLVERLSSVESTRRQLLANLVHELGRPLGAIRSAIQALLKGADKDPHLRGDLLTGLDRETAHLKRLLEDLAGLQGQLLGRLDLNRQPVNLKEWLAATVPAWEAAARERGLTWRVEIPDELPEVVMDPDRMAQALGNLLSNAVKFTPAGGAVSTSVSVEGGELVLQVADSGEQIPPEERESIFEPFHRGARGRRIVQGMGLGLSIARDLAAAHGGGIDLLPASGAGNRFRLHIPAKVP